MHPRRTYFYLTTYKHQPIPSPSQAASFPQRSIISPSLSSESRSDSADAERRRQLSPSPEVDLSSPELDDLDDVDDGSVSVAPLTPSGSFSGRLTRMDLASAARLARNHRAASPPLETDEKEFTQTARGMQRRQLRGEDVVHIPSFSFVGEGAVKAMDLEGELFFGEHHRGGVSAVAEGAAHHGAFVSSPAMKPMVVIPGMSPSVSLLGKRGFEDMAPVEVWVREEMDWEERSPENIDLDELDGMFDNFE